MRIMFLYIGTYTRASSYPTAGKSEGIYVYQVDPATGSATLQSVTKGIDDPSYLTLDSRSRHLYAVSEVGGWDECTVSAYYVDPYTGILRYINKQVTLGASAAHVSLDRADQYVFTSNYSSGQAVAMFPITEDGGLAPACWWVAHEGSGPVTSRQERPHPHFAIADPANRFVYVNDLGIDKIMIYRLYAEHSRIMPASPQLPSQRANRLPDGRTQLDGFRAIHRSRNGQADAAANHFHLARRLSGRKQLGGYSRRA
jgi:6-phosphogluconolactonase